MRKLVVKRGLLKCKLFIFITILNVVNISLFAQAPDWSWAKSAGENKNDWAECIATDKDGYIYVSGIYNSDSITFGSFTLFNTNPGNYGDIFLVKYDSSGNVIWAKSAGGSDFDAVSDIVIDSYGNIFITGGFNKLSITFDNITVNTVDSNVINDDDFFIAKYNSSGNILWAKSGGSNLGDYSTSITCDKEDNIYITGRVGLDPFIFDYDTLSILDTLSSFFLLKLNENGIVIWSKRAGETFNDIGGSLATDSTGNIYVSGVFSGTTITFDSITLYKIGESDNNFIVKYNSLGAVQCAKNIKSNNNSFVNLTTDFSDNLYISGEFWNSTITFDNYTLINYGNADGFIVKYDSLLNVIWAKNLGGNSGDGITSIISDIIGNIYITGTSYSSFINIGDTILSAGGITFVLKFNTFGDLLFAKKLDCSYIDTLTYTNYCIFMADLATDIYGSIYITGTFSDTTANFGNIILNNSYLYWSDFFIAKLNSTITSVNVLENKNSLLIYPNPTTTYLNIELPTDFLTSNQNTITIFDIFGKQLIKQQINSEKSTINTNIFPSGVYIIRVSNEKISSEKRFVKM